jgi:hypothetical protein
MILSLRIVPKWRAWVPALIAIALGSGISGSAQYIMLPNDDVPPRLKKHKMPDRLPPHPTLAPAFLIPVGPLGFGAPGPTYLGRGDALVSLDFLDEDHLLFTFRAPGLMHREADESGPNEPRQMRALVLKVPDGKVSSQALWVVPGSKRYLWMLKDGRFLLRDRYGLRIGNDKLETKPFLVLDGELLSLKIDPSQRVMVTSSYEPEADSSGLGHEKSSSAGLVDGQKSASPANIIVRTVELDSVSVTRTERLREAPDLPISSQGYLEVTHEKLDQWLIKLNSFGGGSRILGHTESTCLPTPPFASEREILVSGCNLAHERKLTALSWTGQQMWETQIPFSSIPPLVFSSLDGSVFARETIVLKEGVRPGSQILWINAVKGQVARVFDSANGKLVLEASLSPTLDAGGNVAFSPSGRRVAVLNEGNLEVFDLGGRSR